MCQMELTVIQPIVQFAVAKMCLWQFALAVFMAEEEFEILSLCFISAGFATGFAQGCGRHVKNDLV